MPPLVIRLFGLSNAHQYKISIDSIIEMNGFTMTKATPKVLRSKGSTGKTVQSILCSLFARSVVGAVSAVLLVIFGLLFSTTAFAQDGDPYFASQEINNYEELAPTQGSKNDPDDLVSALNTVISLQLNGATLEEALTHISNKADLNILYGSERVDVGKEVTLETQEITAQKALEQVLQGSGLGIVAFGNRLALVDRANPEKLETLDSEQMEMRELNVSSGASGSSAAQMRFRRTQTGTITGTVTDSLSGETIPGVNVVVVETQQGASTNANGQYTISGVEVGTYTLQSSFVGYGTKTKENVVVREGETTEVNFELVEGAVALEEVVAVGYGEQERSDLTGAVSSVDGEDLQETPYASLEQSMQGKVAGTNITPYSGEPGSGMDVQIRGVGTFGNTDPLYVVDGVPMQGEDMSTISQSAIESIEVLKDASAAAIYGARASNGVVLITTESGQQGPPQVEYSGNVGIQSFTDHIPLLNSVEYAKLVNESTEAAGLPYEPAFYPADPSQNENLQHDTDWQEEAFRTAPMARQNLRISGGGENSSYMASGEYFGQKGVFVFNHFQRYSARVNTEFQLFDGNVTVGENLSVSRAENFNGGRGNDLHFSYLLGGSPTMRLNKPENEGGYGGPNAEETGVNNRANVIGRRDMRRTQENNNRLFGNAFSEISIISNLNYRFNLGLNVNWGQSQRHHRTYDMDNRQQRRAYLQQDKNESYKVTIENTLNYEEDITDNVHIDLVGGYTQESSFFEFVSGNISEFASNDLRALSAGKGTPSLSGNREEWALQSFVGRANVSLYDKYLITSTFRRDGSSRFGEQNRWGNFPSFALGWILTEENFFPDTNFLNRLKVRGSWGIIGNQQIGNYVNQTTMSTDVRYNFGNTIVNGSSVTSLGNPNLKWEETSQTDIGLDAELLSSRLELHADYFRKNTEGVLLRVPISTATGIDRNSGPFQNAASIQNTGFEFEVRWRQTVGDDGFFSISSNLSTINNKVTSLGGESAIINYVADVYPDYGGFVMTDVGLPMSSFYGWVYDGIFQSQQEIDNHATQSGAQPGDVRFKDLNGDGVINDQDRKVIGNPWPDFTYGVNVSAEYRSFDLGLGIQGVQGRDLYPALRVFLESMNGEHNQMATTTERWQPDDPSETMPRATRNDPNQNVRPSTRFLEDASYLRINNVEVGYSLPETLIEGAGLNRLRVSLRGQNLLTISGYSLYNPDTRGGEGFREISGDPLNMGVDAGAYPIPKSYQIGVEASF